jgi:hypothetical protein
MSKWDPRLLAFEEGEHLYRSIEAGQVDKTTQKPKPNSLRPQFSVQRSKFVGGPSEVKPRIAKFNGVAEISVAAVREISTAHLKAHCVYEPSDSDPSHTLIAITTDVPFGTAGVAEEFEELRARIVDAMSIPQAPTKVP